MWRRLALALLTARCVLAQDTQCDMSIKGALCLFDGRRVMLPDAAPKSLIGHWTFDDMAVTDSSGNKNHAAGPRETWGTIPSGPGLWGRGASGYFNGFDYVQIPHSATFTQIAGEYSMTLWLYLLNNPLKPTDATGTWCPLLRKGEGAGSPGLLLQTQSRKFKFESKWVGGSVDALSSEATLPMERWVHVAMVRSGGALKLYINGLLDSSMAVTGHTAVMAESPLVLGSMDRDSPCNVQVYMDEVRFYGREISKQEVQAEAAPALGGIPPSFAQLGCLKCDVEKAKVSCPASMHVCTEMEIHSGAYQVAMIMGYAQYDTDIWTHADATSGGGGEKLAMCCSNSM